MSQPSSPRVSSRLAYKKRSRNWKDDIFEYTPLTSCQKKAASKPTNVVTHSKSLIGDYQQTFNKNEETPFYPKKRGRPPKHRTQLSLTPKKHPESCHPDVQQRLSVSETSTAKRGEKQTPNNKMKSPVKMVNKDVYSLVTGLVEKGYMQHSYKDEVFSMVAALLPNSRTIAVTTATLQEVANNAGVVTVEYNGGDNLMFGNLENLIDAREKLLEIMKESKCKEKVSVKVESNTDCATTSPEGHSQNNASDYESDSGNILGETATITLEFNGEHVKNSSPTTTPDVDNKLDVIRDLSNRKEEADTIGDGNVTGSLSLEVAADTMKDVTMQQEANDGHTEINNSSYDCIGIIDSNQPTNYVSKRQGPKRRQGKCKHMKESCEICTSYCRLCQYRSTEVAVRKHMQRVHPTTTYDCEVCGMQFGIRYDMRRHRMLHFDDNGLLNKEAKTYLRQNNKLELLSLTLADLEVNFVARKPTTSQIPGGCSDGENNIKSEHATGIITNNESPSSLDIVKADQDEAEVLCGFCNYAGSLDIVHLHHTSRHKVPDSANLQHLCPVCGQGFSPDEFRHHYFEVCAKENGTEKDLNEIRASCKLCHINDTLKVIKTHIENHPEKLYCCVCHFTGNAETMQGHLKKCSRTLKRRRKSHLRNPPKESLVLYKCGICSNIFKTRASLQMHFKSHEVNKIYKCNSCDFQATRAGLLNAHMCKKHATLEERKCDLCGKVFNQVASLRFHKESVHGIGRTSHRCPHCSKVFNTKRFLQVHIKRVHFAVKSYFCRVCKKGFFERARMLDHENVHLLPSEKAKKKHVCSICGKAYSQKSILRQHENIHQGLRPYKCNQCDKCFAFTAQLHKHKVAHRTERPHICIHCGKGFKFPYKLTAHIVMHTKQGRHSCSACNKVYTSRSSLHKHMYQACPVPRNRLAHRQLCSRCNQTFSSSSELHKHQCQMVDSKGVFIMSEKGIDSPGLIVHTDGEQSEVGSNDVLHVLGAENNAQMVPVPSEVIMLTDDTMQDMVTAVEPLDDDNLIIENVKSVFPGEELTQSSILYMCCVCNKLFSEQSQVNAHMELEHEAEAVIAQDMCSEAQQASVAADNLSNLYTITSDNTIVITTNTDSANATSSNVETVSDLNTDIINFNSTVTMATSQATDESPD